MLLEILLPLKCDEVNGTEELTSVKLVRTNVFYNWALRGRLQVS